MSELLEREELLAQLAAARAEGGRLVFVGGEAGVGKTSLVRRFVDDQPNTRVSSGGRATRSSRRVPSARFSMSPWRARGLVQEGAKPHEVAAALIRELETATPAILVLEDVHWADEATLDVLRLLGRRIDAVPALVIATYRNDELENDHPLRIVLGELVAGEAVRRLTIEPLSPRRSRSSPSRTGSTPKSSTERRPGTRSSSPRRSPQEATRSPTRSGTPCSRAPRASVRRRRRCSRRSRSSRRRPSSGCWRRSSERRSAVSTNA